MREKKIGGKRQNKNAKGDSRAKIKDSNVWFTSVASPQLLHNSFQKRRMERGEGRSGERRKRGDSTKNNSCFLLSHLLIHPRLSDIGGSGGEREGGERKHGKEKNGS